MKDITPPVNPLDSVPQGEPSEDRKPGNGQGVPEDSRADAPDAPVSPPPQAGTSSPQTHQYPVQQPNAGWVKMMRGEVMYEVIRHNSHTFILAAIIAARAQYRDGFNRYNLAVGEALLGDHEKYGMTARNYRTAKQQLQKWGLATFKPTPKGTIAKLTDTSLFVVSSHEGDRQNDRQPTNERQAGDKQPTTTKNTKKAKQERINGGKQKKETGSMSQNWKSEIIDPTK